MTDRPARGRWLWPALVCLVTAAYATIPYLVTPWFFQRGDTAAQFAPTWWQFGQTVREGQWPVWMDPGSWAGGNYVGEALFGTYNPLNVLIWVGVSLGSDLAVSTLVVKATVLVLLALGTYLLAREYAAEPWAAAVVAVALPFSGFTLFWDAGSWPSGLQAFAYAPWVWWAMRRTLRGVANPVWAVLIGALAVLNGNPYGTLAVLVVGAALLVEAAVSRAWGGLARLALVGLCIAAFLPLVYLPLLANADLAVRSGGALFENSGKLRPTAGDLLAASSPFHVPPIQAITGPMKVPATFLAWFVLPLLPWLKYGVLRARSREFVGLGLITLVYLAVALGPSKLWLFRWPLRVVEYFYLGLLVVVAVLLSQGLARSAVKPRLVASAAVVVAIGYFSWAQDPASLRRAAAGMALVGVLTAVLLGVHLLLKRSTPVALVALAGIGAVLGAQVMVFGENASSRVWHVPSDVSALQADFADREGRVMQFADLKPLQNQGKIARLEKQWDHFLPGSMYHPAGVEAVNSYTGMGFKTFTRFFCMEYDGLTQPCGYRNLWRVGESGQPPMADLMKLDTIVVAPELAQGVSPGAGWTVAEKSPEVIVLRRSTEHPFPGSELSWTSDGVSVTEQPRASTDGLTHTVGIDAGDGGRLVWSMLAWHGWAAELDGKLMKVSQTKVGLLAVDLPAGAQGELSLTYRPPGLLVGIGGAALGALGAVLLGVLSWRRSRSRRTEPGV